MSNATGKRILFWGSLLATAGSVVGTYFFPPCFVVSLGCLLIAGGSAYSLDQELSEKIKHYERPIDLHELVSDAFPKEDSENRNLLHKSKLQKDNAVKKSRAMNRQEIADETWAKHIFFTEEAKRKKNEKRQAGVDEKGDAYKSEISIVSVENPPEHDNNSIAVSPPRGLTL